MDDPVARLRAEKRAIRDRERAAGHRDLEARRAFNALVGGRAVGRAKERRAPVRASSNTKKKTGIAQRTNPKLWEKAKQKACTEGGLCKHSARKMQWAVRYYKSHGGKYAGKKASTNKLHQWTKQKWRTYSGKKSEGKRRYLPAEAWKHLTKSQIERTNRAKQKGTAKGKQWVRQPKDVARIASKYRKLKK